MLRQDLSLSSRPEIARACGRVLRRRAYAPRGSDIAGYGQTVSGRALPLLTDGVRQETLTDTYFFYGTLSYPPLLKQVLGRIPEMRPAFLDGFAPHVAQREGEDMPFPILRPSEVGVPGVLIETLTEEEDARLRAHEAAYGLHPCDIVLDGIDGSVRAQVFMPDEGRWQAGAPWDLAEWVETHGELATAAAQDVLSALQDMTFDQAYARKPQFLIRAASRVRAQMPRPHALRKAPEAGDVETVSVHIPYAKFFAVEDYELRHKRFDGSMSDVLSRAAFVSGDAAVVLPYDPVRDKVLLIEQFRVGPHARGDSNPWLLEAIAGRIDPGETPEQTVRREAVEEAKLSVSELIAASSFYPSPGAKAEYVYCYLGIADLHEDAAAPGGKPDEGEDIRPHLVSYDTFMALIDSGEIDNGPTLICAMALMRKRDALRQRDSAG
ncbi:NUDIX domain-containing protein [Rhodobacteraceae bacterium]|nr:NUDIX domain-containing protein [Paracoccaceae bacterium]